MSVSLNFLRIFFTLLSTFLMTLFMLGSPSRALETNAFLGIVMGLGFGATLVGFDILFRKYNLRSFNITIIGIFIGYLMGHALVLILESVLAISPISVTFEPQLIELVKVALFIFGIYIGTLMTLRASDDFYISIPFVKFSQASEKKKDLLMDISALSDPRIIDFCITGIVNDQLVIPKFIVKELYALVELSDENIKIKAKRALETIKKLEEIPLLNIRFNKTDFHEINEVTTKAVRLARLLDANILSADLSRAQISSIEGVNVINLHSISTALKPVMQTGEVFKIMVQRAGKDAGQGVGYLEDGTMVVVNRGHSYIGKSVEGRVLSVKSTNTGRIIFMNLVEDEDVDFQSQPAQ